MACASGSSIGVVQMYSCAAEIGWIPHLSSASCMWPNWVELATGDDLRLAFLAGAVAHFVEAVIDEVELEIVVVDASAGLSRNTPILRNWNATLPELPRLPPCFEKMARTEATVRVGLSVAASTIIAMPCGA